MFVFSREKNVCVYVRYTERKYKRMELRDGTEIKHLCKLIL